jgi:CxxC motif-containing protein
MRSEKRGVEFRIDEARNALRVVTHFLEIRRAAQVVSVQLRSKKIFFRWLGFDEVDDHKPER